MRRRLPVTTSCILAYWNTVNDSRSVLLACLLPVGLAIVFHSLLVYRSGGEHLIDPDSYLWLVRVTELSETWAWYDNTIARIDVPDGMSLHWTRPFDLLLLAGTLVFLPSMEFDQALYWSGMWISSVLHICLLLALFWATAPVLDVWRRFLALVAAFGHVGVLVYFVPGRADHHVLILLIFVVSLGLAMRMLLNPHNAKLALIGGATLGLGLWVSTEFLLTIAITLGALALSWVRHGGDVASRNWWHSVGLSGVLFLAVLAEHPPVALLVQEYDRVSIVHLVFALLALGLWTVIWAVERRGRGLGSGVVRLAAAALGALVAGGLLYLIYPKFYGGPVVDVDPRLGPAYGNDVTELQPLLPIDRDTLSNFLVFLGPALLSTPFLAVLLWRDRRGANWEAWLYLGVMTVTFLPLALAMLRFAPYVGLLTAIPLAELLGRLMTASNRFVSHAAVRGALRFSLVGLFVFGFAVAGSAMNLAGPPPPRPACGLDDLIGQLNDPAGLGSRRQLILAHFDRGSELVYRTRHAVLAAPYHRNTAGILDSDRIFRSGDEALSRGLLRRRGVDLILICADKDSPEFQYEEAGFVGGLLRGRVPSWLHRIDTPRTVAGDFMLFEVVR